MRSPLAHAAPASVALFALSGCDAFGLTVAQATVARRPAAPRDAPLTRAAVGAPLGARCLPVVARECNCVYPCGIGWALPAGSATYTVRHPFWESGRAALSGRVEPWCVRGQCTEALSVDLACDGICAPRPADATCHFEGDLCVGAPAR